MKKTLITIIVLVLIALGVYFAFQNSWSGDSRQQKEEEVTEGETEKEAETEEKNEKETVIGTSVEGRDITAYHFGNGDTELLLVGGIHGGYSWNTALVAFEAMDYLEENEDDIPENVKVTVVPVLNPDGLYEVTGVEGRFEASDVTKTTEETIPGRFNASSVDLNRNFDCDWQSTGVWQNREVDGGSAVFSEPEAQAIRAYVDENNPDAVVVYYSAVGGVFASNCHEGVSSETLALMKAYADASGYRQYQDYNFYEITGDMANWLAKEGVPTISVLLTNHKDVEWSKNRAGIEAVLEYYAD